MKIINFKILIPLIIGVVAIVGITVFLISSKSGKGKTTSENEVLMESTGDTEPDKTDSSTEQNASGNDEQNTTTNKETIENGETSGEEVTTEDITTEYEAETTEPITEPSLESETETTFVSEYEPESEAPWVPQPTGPPAPGETNPPTQAPTVPKPTTPAPGEIVTDHVFIEDKNPNLVEGRYEYIPKNVNDKTIHCFYIKDVQDEWEWDVFGDSYYLKWNDWMYFNFDTKDNSNIVTNTLQNNDEKYEGLVLNDQTYKDINHVIKIKTAYSFRKINGKETNVEATFIKPYFYDKTTQTITIKSKELVPKDIYMKYIVQDINSYSYDQIIKDILIEEAGSFYDFYVFWYNNLKGTEFEVFAQETIGLNGVDKFINLYYHDLSEFYDNKMEAIDRMNNKK